LETWFKECLETTITVKRSRRRDVGNKERRTSSNQGGWTLGGGKTSGKPGEKITPQGLGRKE